jgi:hypothetical protein
MTTDYANIRDTYKAQIHKLQRFMGDAVISWSNAIRRLEHAVAEEKAGILRMAHEVDALLKTLGDEPSKHEIQHVQTNAASILHSLNERFPLTRNSNPVISSDEASRVLEELLELFIRSTLRDLTPKEIQTRSMLLAKFLPYRK